MNKKNRTRACIAFPLLLVLLWLVYYPIPAFIFRQQALNAVPQFDALNRQVATELATSSGIELIEKYVSGIYPASQMYGRVLTLEYERSSDQTEDPRDDWDKILQEMGWIRKSSAYYSYYRGTACLSLAHYKAEDYYIDIWHDFWSQPFSPKPVPFWWKLGAFRNNELGILELSHFFEGSIWHCPGEIRGLTWPDW